MLRGGNALWRVPWTAFLAWLALRLVKWARRGEDRIPFPGQMVAGRAVWSFLLALFWFGGGIIGFADGHVSTNDAITMALGLGYGIALTRRIVNGRWWSSGVRMRTARRLRKLRRRPWHGYRPVR